MRKKQKQDSNFGKDILDAIDKGAKAKLKPWISVCDTLKFQQASPELQRRMLSAAKARKLRSIRNSWNPDEN